ncbi:MAG: c-type cytochrome, partial [Elusimicrobiota bacterium]
MRKINVVLLVGALLLVAKLPVVADGKVFAAKCASCHGKDGKGNPVMAKTFKVDNAALDLTDKTTLDKADGTLTKITMDGSGKMPAYKGKISDAQIGSVVAYIRGFGASSSAAAGPAGTLA